MIEIKVGKKYTTDGGYVLRCVSQFSLSKGSNPTGGKFDQEPKYGFAFLVKDGPNESYKNKQVRYYHNGTPFSNKLATGKIVDELNLD